MTNTIDTSLMLSNNQQNTRKTGTNILGKDDFLKILITQLQNQDPLNPMQDKDFIAQMAQFSTLEQMTNIEKSLENFLKSQEQNYMLQASMLIGKTVTFLDSNNEEKTAVVKSVSFKDGKTLFQLNNNENSSIASSQIIKIE
ncbi:flagellar hook assembly protein FlgD [Bacillus methanolicus]|uniref:Flagellar basal body rod modification protein n=1 Tax=Bacillus methanolicus (strain MGA3 / ATCC 53907) TaxID=796606 RepID=I3DZB6_BACMM|nr:flagellar hook assembly protein FlgD [Bacillus methanolicus]AIE59658.1 flagellar basal body rod modification protein [Bacillus methanolicus MGA3]EIJ79587.1 flagellar basal body rod modification protein [Bacillus methanolicus MGA3]